MESDSSCALCQAQEHLIFLGESPVERARLSLSHFLGYLGRHPEQLQAPLTLDKPLDESAYGVVCGLGKDYGLHVALAGVGPEDADDGSYQSTAVVIIGQDESSASAVVQSLEESLEKKRGIWKKRLHDNRTIFSSRISLAQQPELLTLRAFEGVYLVNSKVPGPDDWYRGTMELQVQPRRPGKSGYHASFRFGNLNGLMILVPTMAILWHEWECLRSKLLGGEPDPVPTDYWGDGGSKEGRCYFRFVARRRDTEAFLVGKDNVGMLDFTDTTTMEAEGTLILPLGFYGDDELRDNTRQDWRVRRTRISIHKTCKPLPPPSGPRWVEYGEDKCLAHRYWTSSVEYWNKVADLKAARTQAAAVQAAAVQAAAVQAATVQAAAAPASKARDEGKEGTFDFAEGIDPRLLTKGVWNG
ncbi:hypothetical protein B0H67DRAFT_642190 [Lasiosphaeris hirsuta]|uniref:Uncharacterized protein n=1 Tax=Lasiosphaeris hirsuta TaxID=260670 RepID=A0AA40B185_9PEZI|nr:hypothetical protein B0H67DRAFT_642190 [Lasiosphaeris hirsuta]